MKINRKKLIDRHSPVIDKVESLSPFTIGNGTFAFTADFTGLQTYPSLYKIPLGTQSEWGWNSTGGKNVYQLDDVSFQDLDAGHRSVSYPLYPEHREKEYHWLRQNPHRLQLGQLSFVFLSEDQKEIEPSQIKEISQKLNLWNGGLFSRFSVDGSLVEVETFCDSQKDQLAVKVRSDLLERNRIQIKLAFPSQMVASNVWEESIELTWGNSESHQTIAKIEENDPNNLLINRIIDEDQYQILWSSQSGTYKELNEHEWRLYPQKDRELSFTISFAPERANASHFEQVEESSSDFWKEYWQSGAAIDFSESTDPRAFELERRVILSQYLVVINNGGNAPPQETGLIYNSWFGKFHLEMYWWHVAHFALWGRPHFLEKSLSWYLTILDSAKQLASSQGYEGARWPKMVDHTGKQSPSPIAPVLIWQQPHPVALSELLYLANPTKETLDRWRELVFESASFMASYAVWNERKQTFELGTLIPAQECHLPENSKNPPYELEYWKFGLEIAIKWKERLGEDIPALWRKMVLNIQKPVFKNGLYLAHENCPTTFEDYNHDHPSMVGALGILPGTLIEAPIMLNTLKKVKKIGNGKRLGDGIFRCAL
ncbi:hypothetical protein BTS2_3448 [Bacillus sp. TS-2]|nr:hypothetical protein BTS2_3448 [Bacillus sp. TS-2]